MVLRSVPWIFALAPLVIAACGGSRGVSGYRRQFAYEHTITGSMRLAQGRAHEAVAEFDKARDADPDSVELAILLGEARLAAGDAEGAVAEAETVIAERPDLAAAWTLWGEAALARENKAEAGAAFLRGVALSTETPDPRPFVALADLRIEARDPRSALLVYAALSRLGGFSAEAAKKSARLAAEANEPRAMLALLAELDVPVHGATLAEASIARACRMIRDRRVQGLGGVLAAALAGAPDDAPLHAAALLYDNVAGVDPDGRSPGPGFLEDIGNLLCQTHDD